MHVGFKAGHGLFLCAWGSPCLEECEKRQWGTGDWRLVSIFSFWYSQYARCPNAYMTAVVHIMANVKQQSAWKEGRQWCCALLEVIFLSLSLAVFSANWGVIREDCAVLAALGEIFCVNPVVMVLSICWCLCLALSNPLPILAQSNSFSFPFLLTGHEKQHNKICITTIYLPIYFF